MVYLCKEKIINIWMKLQLNLGFIANPLKLTVAKSQIFRVLSSEAETSSFESDDQDTSEIPCKVSKLVHV